MGFRILTGLGLVVLLAGCGFQPRGYMELPPGMSVYIEGDTVPGAPPSQLGRALQRILESNGTEVVGDPESAAATVRILREDLRRRTLASGPNGEVREYELRYLVEYDVTLADGTEVVPQSTLNLSRDLLYSESDVLGRSEGEELVIRDMVADAARSILRRVEAKRS